MSEASPSHRIMSGVIRSMWMDDARVDKRPTIDGRADHLVDWGTSGPKQAELIRAALVDPRGARFGAPSQR